MDFSGFAKFWSKVPPKPPKRVRQIEDDYVYDISDVEDLCYHHCPGCKCQEEIDKAVEDIINGKE